MQTDSTESFGDWLRRWRTAQHVSQQRLSDMTDGAVTKAYISKLETNRPSRKDGRPALPDREIVISLARALSRPESEALQAAGYSAESPTPDQQSKRLQTLGWKIEQITDPRLAWLVDEILSTVEWKINELLHRSEAQPAPDTIDPHRLTIHSLAELEQRTDIPHADKLVLRKLARILKEESADDNPHKLSERRKNSA